jgi:hypothetical protein
VNASDAFRAYLTTLTEEGVHLTPEQVDAAHVDFMAGRTSTDEDILRVVGFIDQTTYANEDNGPDVEWTNREVLELLADIRSKLTGEGEL